MKDQDYKIKKIISASMTLTACEFGLGDKSEAGQVLDGW